MHVSVSAAKEQLTDLVRRAEAGDEVVLTRDGKPAVRLVPAGNEPLVERHRPTREEKMAVLDRLSGMAKGRPGMEGVTSANIGSFLYEGDNPSV